ncbi:MAG: prepilin peptidase [Patescibacteria group bacterium]
MELTIGTIIFIIGLALGSFVNVVIFRTASGKSLAGRSMCLKCKKQIKAYDNIPVISYFILRGKCRNCKTKISWQYPIVELSTGLLMLAFFCLYPSFQEGQQWVAGDLILSFTKGGLEEVSGLIPPLTKGGLGGVYAIELIRNLVFVPILILLFVYDLRYKLILDRFTLPAIAIALVFNLILGLSIWSMVFGALAVGGFFLAQYLISSGKWIGGGDIRLGILMGVLLGIKLGLAALMISYLIGSIVSVYLILSKKASGSSQVPFGTFLVIGTLIAMLYGKEIVNWYLGLFV